LTSRFKVVLAASCISGGPLISFVRTACRFGARLIRYAALDSKLLRGGLLLALKYDVGDGLPSEGDFQPG